MRASRALVPHPKKDAKSPTQSRAILAKSPTQSRVILAKSYTQSRVILAKSHTQSRVILVRSRTQSHEIIFSSSTQSALVRSRVIRGAHFQGNKPIYLYQPSSEMVLGGSR